MTNKNEKLLPCPHCGGEVTLWGNYREGYDIECQCRNLQHAAKEYVIEAWNKRVMSPETDAFDDLCVRQAIDDFEAVINGSDNEKHDAFVLLKRHTPTIMFSLRRVLAWFEYYTPTNTDGE